MAKVSQAQEPSMEEILASIRRIISDDGDDLLPQPARPADTISTQAIDALFGARPAPDDTDPIPAFLRHETGQPAPRAQRPAEPVERAELRGSIPPAARPRPDPVRAEAPRAEPPRAEAPRAEPPRVEPARAEPARVEPARAEAVRAMAPPQRVTPPVQPAATDMAAPQPAPAAPLAPSQPAATNGALARLDELPPGLPLLSPAADAAVTASFGDLASTLFSGQSRTIEDLVKDMLRPMLKSWLDTNLPPLVERLVRDEIERVSRGR